MNEKKSGDFFPFMSSNWVCIFHLKNNLSEIVQKLLINTSDS